MPATATGLPITLDYQGCFVAWTLTGCLNIASMYDYGPLFTLLSSSLYRTWIPPSQQKTMYIHRIS